MIAHDHPLLHAAFARVVAMARGDAVAGEAAAVREAGHGANSRQEEPKRCSSTFVGKAPTAHRC
jgi:hypothetical protein